MAPAPQFTSVPTQHVVRPLLPAPCPVTLPVLLTNIIPEEFPLPRILMDIDTTPDRAPTPPVCAPTPPRRAPTPAPLRRAPAPAPPRQHPTPNSRESSLTPMESDDEASDSSLTRQNPDTSSQIKRPSGANIQTVRSLFQGLYPHLTEQEQEKEYADFRARLDVLCTQYLRPSVALTYQDKDARKKVNAKIIATSPWLTDYADYWPVSVCLQGKLHNSAARAVEKSTRKAVSILAGVAPTRARKAKTGTR